MNLVVFALDGLLLSWLAVTMYRRQPVAYRSLYFPALAFKVIAGIAVGILYFSHYGQGDTLVYWQDGIQIAGRLTSDPIGALKFFWDESSDPVFAATLNQQTPRSLFFSKIAGILAFLTAGNYWLMATVASFVSFLAAWHLFHRIVHCFPSAAGAASVAFLFYPSVIFWSSGLIKESLGLAALFFLIATFLLIVQGKAPTVFDWLGIACSLWIGWNLKYYWMGIFLPVVITTVLVTLVIRSRPGISRYDIALWCVGFFLLLLLVTSVHPNFYPSRFLEVICQSNLEFMRLTDPAQAVHFYKLQPTLASVSINAPVALVAGLFRPFIWESHHALSFLAGVENLVVLLLVILAIPALRNVSRSPHRLLILAAVVYTVLLVTFLALSTPNLGTLSRYKVGAMPILLFLLLSGNTALDRWVNRWR